MAVPTQSQLEDVQSVILEIRWNSVWTTVTESSTPPAVILSGGPTGAFWRIGGLAPDTQYQVRFRFICVSGGPCESGTTTFTTDESSSSSSSSSSACPCSGPKPEVVITGIAELGVRVPTSGMTNVTGDPDLQILWDGTWTTVTEISTPPGVILESSAHGRYWSVTDLVPVTTYLLRHVFHCTGGGSCEGGITEATTGKNPLCPTPRVCRE